MVRLLKIREISRLSLFSLNLDAAILERLFSHRLEFYLGKYSEIIVEIRKNIITSQRINVLILKTSF